MTRRYVAPTVDEIAAGVNAACDCDGRGCWLCMAADTIRDLARQLGDARETILAVMVRLVPAVSDAAIVGKTYDHRDVLAVVDQVVMDLRAESRGPRGRS